MLRDKTDQAANFPSLAIQFPCDVNAVGIEEEVTGSGSGIRRSGFRWRVLIRGWIHRRRCRAKTETGTIRADAFRGNAEADRMICFVELYLFDPADREHAGAVLSTVRPTGVLFLFCAQLRQVSHIHQVRTLHGRSQLETKNPRLVVIDGPGVEDRSLTIK